MKIIKIEGNTINTIAENVNKINGEIIVEALEHYHYKGYELVHDDRNSRDVLGKFSSAELAKELAGRKGVGGFPVKADTSVRMSIPGPATLLMIWH